MLLGPGVGGVKLLLESVAFREELVDARLSLLGAGSGRVELLLESVTLCGELLELRGLLLAPGVGGVELLGQRVTLRDQLVEPGDLLLRLGLRRDKLLSRGVPLCRELLELCSSFLGSGDRLFELPLDGVSLGDQLLKLGCVSLGFRARRLELCPERVALGPHLVVSSQGLVQLGPELLELGRESASRLAQRRELLLDAVEPFQRPGRPPLGFVEPALQLLLRLAGLLRRALRVVHAAPELVALLAGELELLAQLFGVLVELRLLEAQALELGAGALQLGSPRVAFPAQLLDALGRLGELLVHLLAARPRRRGPTVLRDHRAQRVALREHHLEPGLGLLEVAAQAVALRGGLRRLAPEIFDAPRQVFLLAVRRLLVTGELLHQGAEVVGFHLGELGPRACLLQLRFDLVVDARELDHPTPRFLQPTLELLALRRQGVCRAVAALELLLQHHPLGSHRVASPLRLVALRGHRGELLERLVEAEPGLVARSLELLFELYDACVGFGQILTQRLELDAPRLADGPSPLLLRAGPGEGLLELFDASLERSLDGGGALDALDERARGRAGLGEVRSDPVEGVGPLGLLIRRGLSLRPRRRLKDAWRVLLHGGAGPLGVERLLDVGVGAHRQLLVLGDGPGVARGVDEQDGGVRGGAVLAQLPAPEQPLGQLRRQHHQVRLQVDGHLDGELAVLGHLDVHAFTRCRLERERDLGVGVGDEQDRHQ